VEGADDYAMLREVLERRYRHREHLPDLIMMDGGKGQLGIALFVLRELGIEGPDVIGLAKGIPGKGKTGLPAVRARAADPGKRIGSIWRAGRIRSTSPGTRPPIFSSSGSGMRRTVLPSPITGNSWEEGRRGPCSTTSPVWVEAEDSAPLPFRRYHRYSRGLSGGTHGRRKDEPDHG